MSHRPFVIHDTYFQEAKRLGYRARSAFKLLEILEKFPIVHAGDTVIDVASAPGSFLQVLRKVVGNDGLVIGFDLTRIDGFGYPNIRVFQADIRDPESITSVLAGLGVGRVPVITSDIAPSTTGQTGVDQYRSVELNLAVVYFADRWLAMGGSLVLKVFVGEDIQDLIGPIKERYRELRRIKPRACRDRSFEEYFVCLDKKSDIG